MNSFQRTNPLFSLCGLNCGLCSMRLGGHCPGCGSGNRACKAARCGMDHDVEYCFQCGDYPCAIYKHADDYDSFITHKNQKADMEKASKIGIDAYNAEQTEKVRLLNMLLSKYNSGREKTLYCLAVNLLDIDDIKGVLEQASKYNDSEEFPIKEKAAYVSKLLRQLAQQKNIELKLKKNKRP